MPDSLDNLELLISRPAYSRLEDYFGLWAMYEPHFAGMFDVACRTDFAEHIGAARSEKLDERKAAKALGIGFPEADTGLQVTAGGIAVISLVGTLMKTESSFSESTSTVATRQKIRAAKNSPDVLGVAFRFETPGGTVAGTQALADDIAALEKVKPTAGYAEDLCASAGYWCLSQCGLVATNPTGLVGSIGTFMAVRDTSGAAEQMKVKVHVIRAGALKGAGTPGTAITDEMLAAWQEMVNGLNDQFVSSAAAGRKMTVDQMRAVADGRVFVGQSAMEKGLVDKVQSWDETIQQLMERAGSSGRKSSPTKGTKMTQATYEELKSNLIGADAGFLVSQLDAKVDLATGIRNWMTEQNTRAQASSKDAAEARELLAKAPQNGGGIGSGRPKAKADDEKLDSEFEDPISEFEDAVADRMKLNGGDKDAAVLAVARRNPALHVAYKQATNPEFADQIGRHARQMGIKS